MTPGCRAWTERFVAQLEARVALYRRIGTGCEGQDVIVGILQSVIARHRAALDAAGARPDAVPAIAPAPAPAPVPAAAQPSVDRMARGPGWRYPPGFKGEPGSTSWSNPVFWVDGFNPFAGTYRDRMLASAAVCRSFGDEISARGFEARAAGVDRRDRAPDAAPIPVDEAAQARLAVVAPFSAGEQIGLFE